MVVMNYYTIAVGNGHNTTTILSNFKKGHRCKFCATAGEHNSKWNPDREQVKLNELVRKKCYAMLRYCFKMTNQIKKIKTHQILGYSPKELREYIENHPEWDKVKNTDWHLDHIFPIKAFIDYGINDLKLINSLDNLQPCLKDYNLFKKDKYSKYDFERWLEKHK